MKFISPKIIRQIFMLLLILLLGGLIFFKMMPFLGGVLGAITLYVLLRKPTNFLIAKGWGPGWASALSLLFSFVCILIPIVGMVLMLLNKVDDVAQQSEKLVEVVGDNINVLESYIGYDITSEIDPSEVSSWFTSSLQNLIGSTFNMLISIGIMYFLLFYMLTQQKELHKSLLVYIPISDENLKVIAKESNAKVRSNAIGIPLVALVQGGAALIGFLIFGIEDPFFWFVIVFIGSMVPFIGALLGIIPVFILTISSGNEFQAWGILIYGLTVVGAIDNIVRLYVLKKLDNVHPLVTLIGVIIGVPLFGFIGLIFGPLLISLFQIVIRIYRHEYGAENKAKL